MRSWTAASTTPFARSVLRGTMRNPLMPWDFVSSISLLSRHRQSVRTRVRPGQWIYAERAVIGRHRRCRISGRVQLGAASGIAGLPSRRRDHFRRLRRAPRRSGGFRRRASGRVDGVMNGDPQTRRKWHQVLRIFEWTTLGVIVVAAALVYLFYNELRPKVIFGLRQDFAH